MGRTKEPGVCLKTRGGEGYRGEAQSETGRGVLCKERRETGTVRGRGWGEEQ